MDLVDVEDLPIGDGAFRNEEGPGDAGASQGREGVAEVIPVAVVEGENDGVVGHGLTLAVERGDQRLHRDDAMMPGEVRDLLYKIPGLATFDCGKLGADDLPDVVIHHDHDGPCIVHRFSHRLPPPPK